MVELRVATQEDRPRIVSFYAHTQYGQAISEDDQLFLAEQGGTIVGALRLTTEHGVRVLRGMRIAKDHQRKGVGKALVLKATEAMVDESCYCIPHRNLVSFYENAGFSEVQAQSAPAFLQERLAKYRRELGLDVILMKRDAGHPTAILGGAGA